MIKQGRLRSYKLGLYDVWGGKLEWEEEKYLQGAKNLFLRRRIFLFFIFGWGAFILFLLADKIFLDQDFLKLNFFKTRTTKVE